MNAERIRQVIARIECSRIAIDAELKSLGTYLDHLLMHVRQHDDATDDAPDALSLLDRPLCSLREWTPRTLNVLERHGITTFGQLTSHSLDELLCLPGFGETSLNIVEDVLRKHNLKLRA